MNNELIADGQLLGDYDSDVVSALIPFAYWYDLNDCDNSTKGHIEVPIEDLRRAYNAIGDENIAERYHLQNVVMHTELIERPLCPDTVEAAAIRKAIEPVYDWYQGDEEDEQPLVTIIENIVADLSCDRANVIKLERTIRNLKGEL